MKSGIHQLMAGRSLPPRINRSIADLEGDLGRVAAKAVLKDLLEFRADLDRKSLRYTNWVGKLAPGDPGTDRVKLWEDVCSLLVTNPSPGSLILDAGGASTLFSFYLAARGLRVVVADIDYFREGLLQNARSVARELQLDLRVLGADIARGLPFPPGSFDGIYCLCVLEHLPPPQRRAAAREMGRLVKPGGILALTIDYVDRRSSERGPFTPDRGLRFRELDKLYREVIEPSGLRILGNPDLQDGMDEKWFVGCLFLVRES